MKILLLSEVFPPQTGGSGRWFWEIYRRLPRAAVTVVAGMHARQDEFDRTHDLAISRAPLALSTWGIASWAGLREYWQAYRAVRDVVRREGVTEIHCGKSLPEGWIAWLLSKRHGLPYVCYVHGEEINVAAQSRELTWMTRRVLHGARQVIVNSRNTARIVEQAVALPAERVHVLHPGVDVEKFTPAPRDAAIRAELGWGDRPVVLTVGRLQKRKGHDQLIRALPQIRATVPDVLYAIVGDGEQRAQLEREVDDLGLQEAVRFHGDLGDEALVRVYQQCDLFVLPNREVAGDIEGFGMVLLEAQACGRPVIAGASVGTAETMRVGATGRIVPCETPGPLAEAIVELLDYPALRTEMGVAGRQWTVEHFGWDALSEQAQRIFKSGEPDEGGRRRAEGGKKPTADSRWPIADSRNPTADSR